MQKTTLSKNRYFINYYFYYANCFFSKYIDGNLTPDNGIVWNVKENDSHLDNIEMSGFYTSAIVHYGCKKGGFYNNK